MFDIIGEGLLAQKQLLDMTNAAYTRIVRSDELLDDVHFEAQIRGCSVWVDAELRKAVISRNSPGVSYTKVHVKGGRVSRAFSSEQGAV